jgi:hypothetical protein
MIKAYIEMMSCLMFGDDEHYRARAALYLTLIDLVAGVALLIIRYRLAMKCLPFVFPKKTVA